MSQILLPPKDAEFSIKELIDADEKFDIDTSFEKVEQINGNNNGAEDIKEPSTKEDNNSSNNKAKLNKSHISAIKQKHHTQSLVSPNDSFDFRAVGPKHKLLFNNISNTIHGFLEGYNNIFFEDIVKKHNEEVAELNEEKYSKKFVIFKNYHTQIAEMELMMKENDGHEESIKVIIENLEEERDKEILKLEDEYKVLFNEKEKSLKETKRKTSPGLKMVEEKFKVDMLSILSEIIYPKK